MRASSEPLELKSVSDNLFPTQGLLPAGEQSHRAGLVKDTTENSMN